MYFEVFLLREELLEQILKGRFLKVAPGGILDYLLLAAAHDRFISRQAIISTQLLLAVPRSSFMVLSFCALRLTLLSRRVVNVSLPLRFARPTNFTTSFDRRYQTPDKKAAPGGSYLLVFSTGHDTPRHGARQLVTLSTA